MSPAATLAAYIGHARKVDGLSLKPNLLGRPLRNLFFWTPARCIDGQKCKSSQANSGCMLSRARRVHPVIVGCSTAPRAQAINDNP